MHVHEKILRIICAVLLAAAAFALASLFVDASPWYQNLRKPQLLPHPIVFSAVWVLLYTLFAASLSLLLTDKNTPKKAYELFIITALLNSLWTYTFFYLQNPAGALFVLVLIICCAIKLFTCVYNANRIAAYLIIPFIVWVCFAVYLNYELVFLN